MVQKGEEDFYAITKIKKDFVDQFPPAFAKLYSQFTRLNTGQNSLLTWRKDEAYERLNDAIRLIGAALIEKEEGITNWQDGMRRAGELLEWLSQPSLNTHNLPLRFLSATTYQYAGYPARSTSLLGEEIIGERESKILFSFLKANFPSLLKHITEHWAKSLNYDEGLKLTWSNTITFSNQFSTWLIDQTINSLGVITSAMRWGEEKRTMTALKKLISVSKLYLQGYSPYSWLLAKLVTETAFIYLDNSMRSNVQFLSEGFDDTGKKAIERYLRLGYQTCRSLAWPSQIEGIKRLLDKDSFTLCTPTGSGKTTIAELAILQSLFNRNNDEQNEDLILFKPLVMYLVPSRALAAEVESKLSGVFKKLTSERIIVTGLYGGTDWGPTDAWLTSMDRGVLICTYEKAEALIKFIGPLFLHRISLIIIDEVHSVQYDGNEKSLRAAENRALRLESIGTRVFSYLENYQNSRVIGLSAVAHGVEDMIANWLSGDQDAVPVKTSYRSTRQLVGCLRCLKGSKFEIRYDLLDGSSLQFEEDGKSDRPFIPNPFPPYPPEKDMISAGPDKRLRPYLFWAAMQLATPDEKGLQRAVLVYITQGIEGYAQDFLRLLGSDWKEEELPKYYYEPKEPRKIEILKKCLQSCEDYYGSNSREYKLLKKGIVVHHGKMPGSMARLLIEVIQEKIVHIVLATSTLSEGVNLPFDTVLIPSLRRYGGDVDIREFGNLIGRAGRPGYGIEGRSLVLLDERTEDWSSEQGKLKYKSLIQQLRKQNKDKAQGNNAKSPLAELIIQVFKLWNQITNSNSKCRTAH